MISSTVPRPIALVSTVTADGLCQNLAPFSYFNTVSVDPPLYSVSFVGKAGNDSLKNVLTTEEMCISIISDWYLEAANFTSVNTASHISEWPLAGLHPVPSQKVKPPHVAEAAFSMECKLHSSIPILSKTDVDLDGKPVCTATLVLVEAVMYHVYEDAIDEKLETVDMRKLRPVWRAGGITYGSCFGGWETPRPEAFGKLLETDRVRDIMKGLGNK
jgi:flavin reductase (DIM6/NTAB) family NADH-FMN oxidoreductase RutF